MGATIAAVLYQVWMYFCSLDFEEDLLLSALRCCWCLAVLLEHLFLFGDQQSSGGQSVGNYCGSSRIVGSAVLRVQTSLPIGSVTVSALFAGEVTGMGRQLLF